MKYALLYYESPADLAAPEDRASGTLRGQWMAYVNALVEAGVMRGGAGLHVPATGTTVRLSQGSRRVQDGPYADTREQLGGFILIDVPDLDSALEWASRAPCAATGAVEVRPTLPEG